jgi:hypothetical protein
MSDLAPPAAGVALATFVYLVFDTYPIVKSFGDTLRSGSFYLLWLTLSVLNLISYGVLKVGVADKISAVVGPSLTPMTLVLLATVGTIGILQSLTFKLADYRFIDVEKLIDGFKTTVRKDIGRISADRKRLKSIDFANKLSKKYTLADLRTEYASVMTYQGRNLTQVGQELTQLENDCTTSNTSFERAICERIAQADISRADEMLRRP